MKNKIESYKQKILPYIEMAKDVRALGLLAFLVVALMVTWSGVKVIEQNYTLQRQISGLQQQNDVQKLANDNLRLGNTYFESKDYLDVAARENFGLALPGETVWAVSQNVALAHTANLVPKDEIASSKTTKKSVYQRNFQAWMDFLLGRGLDKT